MAKFFVWPGGTVRLPPEADVAQMRTDLEGADQPETELHQPVIIEGVDGNNPLGKVTLFFHPWANDWYYLTDSPED